MGGYEKFTVAALALTTLLSGSAFARPEELRFMRAGSATVRPTEKGRVVRWGIKRF